MSTDHSGRVTVDIDGYESNFELLATRAYHNLDHMADSVDVHISSSGEGIHLVGWFEQAVDLPDRIKMRRMLRDDKNRIRIDVERAMNGIYTGVLWSEKHSNVGPTRDPEKPSEHGRKDRDFADVHDALEHMRMTNSDPSEQMQRLAEYGHKRQPELARRAEPAAAVDR